MRYKAIIWDCDGVLIDSEVLACAEMVKLLGDLGYKTSLESFIGRFIGKTVAQIFCDIEEETDLSLAETFPYDALYQKQKEIFSQSLQPTVGVQDVLQALELPMAVGSGSGLERLYYTLTLTKLIGYFKGHIYSSEMVQNGKPAPDIFLHAAKQLNVQPKDCLVIEDGIHGIHAAQAAGMDVYAYVGGSHMTEKLKQNIAKTGVPVILHHMEDLLPLLSHQPAKAAG